MIMQVGLNACKLPSLLIHHFTTATPIISRSDYPGKNSCSRAYSQSIFLKAISLSINSIFGSTAGVDKVKKADMSELGLHYPVFRRDDSLIDNYHGTEVADPYRWLEDPDSKETQEFVTIQNKITQNLLEASEIREKFKARMTEMYNYPKYGCPFRYGENIFYFFNTGLQAQSVLYMQKSLDSKPEVLLDPNTLSADGTVSLASYSFSEDGMFMAYGLSSSGSDWQTVKVLKTNQLSGQRDLPDTLKWVKHSSLAWTHDSKGFFYNRFPEPLKAEDVDAGTETDINLNQQLCYHWLGTDQSEDLLCWEDSQHPKWMSGAEVTDDGKYLLLSISEGCDPVNRLFYCNLQAIHGGLESLKAEADSRKIPPPPPPLLPWVKLVDNFDAQYAYVANDGPVFTFHTNKEAPKYKLERVDLGEANRWHDVIGEGEDVLEWARCVHGDRLFVCFTRDVKSLLQIRSLSDGSLLLPLPLDIGSVSSSSGKREHSEIFYSFTGFLSPGTIYRCDLAQENPTPETFRETTVEGFDPSLFESSQVFVTSKDGTKVPMFVVARRGTPLDGSSPALLYGYGGFSISLLPAFSVARILLMRHLAAVVAVGNVRGGNEYGEAWHREGTLGAKQNCFDDFQSCAEYLIHEGYTSAAKLCIEGGSNGGLLVAACINQRPELFGCAIAHVGVMDMLRFHKFTVGHNWTSDYGCADDPLQFQWLIKYSPLHNIKKPWLENRTNGEADNLVQYPATMVLTGDHDDRVVPLHSLKYIATLQHELVHSVEGQSPQTNPIVARIETKAGHGAGRPTKKIIDQHADVYSFMAEVVHAQWID